MKNRFSAVPLRENVISILFQMDNFPINLKGYFYTSAAKDTEGSNEVIFSLQAYNNGI